MGVLWNSNSSKTRVSSAVTDDAAPAPQPPEPRRYGWFVLGLGVLAVLVVLWFVMAQEVRSSKLQAREFSRFAASLSYSMHEGPSNAMLYPGAGPFDKRLGYSALGDFLARLQKRDYVITQQSRFSPALLSYSEKGFFVPYSEKFRPDSRSPTALAVRFISTSTRSSCIPALQASPAGGSQFAVYRKPQPAQP